MRRGLRECRLGCRSDAVDGKPAMEWVGMARSRNLKPSFFTNEELGKLDDAACLLFAGLWTIADREGRLKDSPDWIKALIFPYKRRPVDALLGKLAAAGFIHRYEVGGVRYIQVARFLKHQTPHAKEPASTIPAPDLSETGLITVCHSIDIDMEEGNGRGNQEEDRARGKFEPPTVEQVAAYCRERSNGIDPEAFMAHYTSNGWMVGKNKMKDWRSAVITFEKNRDKFSNGRPARTGPGQVHDPNAKAKDPNHGRM